MASLRTTQKAALRFVGCLGLVLVTGLFVAFSIIGNEAWKAAFWTVLALGAVKASVDEFRRL